MNSTFSKISVLLFLWNPVTLSLLFKSIVWGVGVSIGVVVIGLLICRLKSLRIKVWAFNITTLLSIGYHAELLFIQLGTDRDVPNLYELHDKFYFNKPFLNQKFSTDEYVSTYRTNCQGYRIDLLTNADDSITACDWLFIGDSFTQGAQVEYNQLFTTLIYKHFPDKIIVNAGISGAGLYEELNYFKELGQKLKPQRVFLQIGVFNDFMDIVEHRTTFQDYLSEKSSLYRYLVYNMGKSDEIPLGRWMEPFFVNLQDNIDDNILYKPTSEKKKLDKKRFGDCISEFKKCVEAIGAELVLILLPSKEQISPTMFKETLKVCNLQEKDIDLMAANKLCLNIAQKEKLKLIDLYKDFKSSDFPFFQMDEHLSILGHEIIANRIISEYSIESDRYFYYSQCNRNERYPSLLRDSTSILYQSQERDYYLICKRGIKDDVAKTLWSSVKELVHPSINQSLNSMVFTVGNQEKQQTEVVLYNFEENSQVILNTKGFSASIPMFNYSGTKIVFSQWENTNTIPFITIYDIEGGRNICSFKDGDECWRPIFSHDDKQIYYICRETDKSTFIIKSYSLAEQKSSTLFKTNYDIWDIALSPSGKYIAYAGNKDNNWDLFVLDLKSKNVKQITQTLGNEWDPSYGYNDKDLWFAGEYGVNNGVYHMTIE